MKKRVLLDIGALLAAALLVFFDQISKYWVRTSLTGGREIVVWKGVFKLVSHRNTGAVWGIFSDKTDILSIVTVLVLIVIVFVYFRIPWGSKRLLAAKIICVFITAGAIGNLIDRISLKYVVDFLYFELIDFPVFNIADCYITVSTILLAVLCIFYYKDEDIKTIWPEKSK